MSASERHRLRDVSGDMTYPQKASSVVRSDGDLSEPDLMTAYETAELLRISTSTLHEWATREVGPSVYRLGPRHHRWDRRDVLEWLESRRSGVGPPARTA